MVDAQEAGSDPDRVVPPPPFDAAEPAAASVPPLAPLAPPLGPPPPPLPPPPATPLPPYATAAYQPAPYQPAPYPSAPYPSAPYPSPSLPPSSNRLGIILAVVGGFVVLAVVGVAVAVGLLLGASDPSTPAQPTAVAEDPDAPAEEPPTDDTPDTDPAPDEDPSGIAARLEAKIDEYKRLRDSGALWQSIPDTEFNRTAVSAYLYLMTDMKVATIWGIDAQQAQEYDERMVMLEQRLLAQEPLGDDISITLEDKVFTYDGETGEGGYTPK